MSNPFANCRTRPGAIPFQFPPGQDAAQLVGQLARLGWRAAIVGPHGTGKSTLLAALTPAIVGAGRNVRSFALHDGQRRLPAEFLANLPERDGIAIVDGYEQLNFWSRWRLDRRCRATGCGLLVTAHRPTALPLLFRTSVDADLAERIVEQLLASRSDGDPAIAGDVVRCACSKHRGNLREMFFDLYDAFENRRIHSRNLSC